MSFLRSQTNKMASIKSYLIIMNKVRIFCFVHTVGREVNHTSFLVYMLYLPHIEFAFRHLTDQASFLPVVQINMIATIAFAGPQNTTTVTEVVAIKAVIVDVLLVGLLNERSHSTRLSIQFQQSIGLMTTFIEGKGQRTAIAVPVGSGHMILMSE